MGWLIYLLYFPIGLAITAYLTWLIFGIIDAFIEDNYKKKCRERPSSNFGAALFIYTIILFTNIFSVNVVLDNPHNGSLLPADVGTLGLIVSFIMSACTIRFAAYGINRNNLAKVFKTILHSKYSYFAKVLVLLDFGYVCLIYSGPDGFWDIVYGCISWIILIMITIIVGMIFDDDSIKYPAISNSNHYRSPAVILIPFFIAFIILVALMIYTC